MAEKITDLAARVEERIRIATIPGGTESDDITALQAERFREIAVIFRLLETGIYTEPKLRFREGLFQDIAPHFKVLDDGDFWRVLQSSKRD